MGACYIFLPLGRHLFEVGANSRLGAYSNKYGTPDPVENITKFFNIFIFLMFPCKSNLLFSDGTLPLSISRRV